VIDMTLLLDPIAIPFDPIALPLDPEVAEALDLLADAIPLDAPDVLCATLDQGMVELLLAAGARHVWFLADGEETPEWSDPARVTAVAEEACLVRLPVDWVVGVLTGDDAGERARDIVRSAIAPTLYLWLAERPNGWERDRTWHRASPPREADHAGAYCFRR
jgi:hypothetical protein